MTKKELQDALKAKGIAFSESANVAELEALLNASASVVSDDLLKIIQEKGGYAFDSKELQEQLKADKENEYPDFGRDIPTGEYVVTGYSTVHDWKNKRTDRISHIRTAFVKGSDDSVWELPFVCFCASEWEFVQFNGKDSDGKIIYKKVERKSILPFYSSVADRNLAVTQKIAAGTRISVHHERGHYDNPYNTGRVFDFLLTWAELA